MCVFVCVCVCVCVLKHNWNKFGTIETKQKQRADVMSLSWGIIFSVRGEKKEEAGEGKEGARREGRGKKGRSGIINKNASSNFARIRHERIV